jgi:hypothetical protein
MAARDAAEGRVLGNIGASIRHAQGIAGAYARTFAATYARIAIEVNGPGFAIKAMDNRHTVSPFAPIEIQRKSIAQIQRRRRELLF